MVITPEISGWYDDRNSVTKVWQTDGQTDRQTEISVLRAAWSQLKTIEHLFYATSTFVHHFHWWIRTGVTIRRRPIWVKFDNFLSRVTLKFDGWPSKTIGHLFYATSTFVLHFVAMGEFKLELRSGNAQSGSNSTIFRAMWPWNLTDDLEKQ